MTTSILVLVGLALALFLWSWHIDQRVGDPEAKIEATIPLIIGLALMAIAALLFVGRVAYLMWRVL